MVALVGLAARFGLPGAFGDWAGGIAYTAFAYGLIALIWPALPPRRVGVAAFGWSAAVELLQLAGLAGALVDRWSPLRLALGESFAVVDFAAYALGAALAAAADARWLREPCTRSAPERPPRGGAARRDGRSDG